MEINPDGLRTCLKASTEEELLQAQNEFFLNKQAPSAKLVQISKIPPVVKTAAKTSVKKADSTRQTTTSASSNAEDLAQNKKHYRKEEIQDGGEGEGRRRKGRKRLQIL